MRVPPFIIQGIVESGAKRGRVLGYPTINMKLSQCITHGVYISETDIAGVWYPSATFIGAAKTFGQKTVRAETYILDFTGDLYGKKITVRLHSYIRPNIKFPSVEKLQIQMKHDVELVRDFKRAGIV